MIKKIQIRNEVKGDQLYLGKMLLQEVKWRKKNLMMEWINYWKAYDMVAHPWMLESLNMMA